MLRFNNNSTFYQPFKNTNVLRFFCITRITKKVEKSKNILIPDRVRIEFEYIDGFCNRKRPHSINDFLSSDEKEALFAKC